MLAVKKTLFSFHMGTRLLFKKRNNTKIVDLFFKSLLQNANILSARAHIFWSSRWRYQPSHTACGLFGSNLYFCWGCGTTYNLLIVGAPLPADADVRKLLPSWGPFLHVTLSLARAARASLQHPPHILPLDLFELYTPLNCDTVYLARSNHSSEDVNTLNKAHYNRKGGSLHYFYVTSPHLDLKRCGLVVLWIIKWKDICLSSALFCKIKMWHLPSAEWCEPQIALNPRGNLL